jgi:hypothetical protein
MASLIETCKLDGVNPSTSRRLRLNKRYSQTPCALISAGSDDSILDRAAASCRF